MKLTLNENNFYSETVMHEDLNEVKVYLIVTKYDHQNVAEDKTIAGVSFDNAAKFESEEEAQKFIENEPFTYLTINMVRKYIVQTNTFVKKYLSKDGSFVLFLKKAAKFDTEDEATEFAKQTLGDKFSDSVKVVKKYFDKKDLKENIEETINENLKEKFVIYKENGVYCVTPESNYNNHIQNAFKIQHCDDGFKTAKDVINYYNNYLNTTDDDFIVIEDKNDSIKLDGVILEFVEGGHDTKPVDHIVNIVDMNNWLAKEHLVAKKQNEGHGYDKAYVDCIFSVGDKKYRVHALRYDLGDRSEDHEITGDDIKYCEDLLTNYFKDGKSFAVSEYIAENYIENEAEEDAEEVTDENPISHIEDPHFTTTNGIRFDVTYNDGQLIATAKMDYNLKYTPEQNLQLFADKIDKVEFDFDKE